MVKKNPSLILNLALLLVLAMVYGLTLALNITWANRGADGADLITAAYTGGVPHPSGYPTYMLIARLFQYLPWGTLAFRTNLMSAVFAILAAILVSHLARGGTRVENASEWLQSYIGFLAGLAFGLSSLFWSQAVITEVYSLHAFFLALILVLTPLAKEVDLFRNANSQNRAWLDRLGGLVFGLALGNQLTIVFLLPAWLLMGVFESGSLRSSGENISLRLPKMNWRKLSRRVVWLILGLTVYLTILVRARSGSAVNWGKPVDLEGLWWLISGQLYQDRVFNLEFGYLWPRIRNWAGLLQAQFGLPGMILGFFGLLYGKPRLKRFCWITFWIFLAYSVFAVGYNSSDSYVLLIPAFMVFALWIGLGMAEIFVFVSNLKQRQIMLPLAAILFALAITLNTLNVYPTVGARKDHRAVEFATEVLEKAPNDALLFVHADEDTFTLQYYTYALGQRPDLVVLNDVQIYFDWYRQNMREIYPDLVIPETDCFDCVKNTIIVANDRPVCDVALDGDTLLDCQP